MCLQSPSKHKLYVNKVSLELGFSGLKGPYAEEARAERRQTCRQKNAYLPVPHPPVERDIAERVRDLTDAVRAKLHGLPPHSIHMTAYPKTVMDIAVKR